MTRERADAFSLRFLRRASEPTALGSRFFSNETRMQATNRETQRGTVRSKQRSSHRKGVCLTSATKPLLARAGTFTTMMTIYICTNAGERRWSLKANYAHYPVACNSTERNFWGDDRIKSPLYFALACCWSFFSLAVSNLIGGRRKRGRRQTWRHRRGSTSRGCLPCRAFCGRGYLDGRRKIVGWACGGR